MTDFKELRKILNAGGMSVRKNTDGSVRVLDSCFFKGASLSAVEEAQSLVEHSVREDSARYASRLGIPHLDTLKDVNERACRMVSSFIDIFRDGKIITQDEMRSRVASSGSIRDSIFNPRWNLGNASDPSRMNVAFPNVYISPWEASSLYSQKGIFETVINKKAKSILLNGLSIENPLLTSRELEEVNRKADVLHLKSTVSDAVRDSLVYGGGIVFPVFRKDNPSTMHLPLNTLLKLSILKKDCIDYMVKLDRWNCFIIPPTNPTQKDFYSPEVYTVPFLGADVYHARCARVVTAEQAGYWGQIINQGWGISDLTGYLQSGMNYKVAVQSIPLMIQQMSILARVVNVDGVLATEGANALDALVEQNTVRTREASSDNPVTMDVLGDIKSIDRNFSQVPELIRLLRQDFASDCTIPEPMLFSSEKGNFSSGDDTEGNMSKQWEAVKMIHKDVERQFTQVAKIFVIDALGTEERVIKALPYTKIRFDEPVLANAVERGQIGKLFSENVFNLVSARVPLDIAFETAARNTSSEVAPSIDTIERLKEIQRKADERDDERFALEMAEDEPKEEPSGDEEAGKGLKNIGGGKKGVYTRLEQKTKERVRLGSSKRSEKLVKAESKKI